MSKNAEKNLCSKANGKRVTFSLCGDKINAAKTKSAIIQNDAISLMDSKEAFQFKDPVYFNICRRSDSGGKVQKTLVRNFEYKEALGIKRKKSNNCNLISYQGVSLECTDPPKENLYWPRYYEPELYTSLCLAKEIQNTRKVSQQIQIENITDIAPIARQILAGKVMRKVNFPQEEHLYHDLVSLSINDDSLFSSNDDKHHRREVSSTNKDLEPQLSDFFTPSFGEERHLLDRPSFKGVEVNRRFNGFILYKRQQVWSLID